MASDGHSPALLASQRASDVCLAVQNELILVARSLGNNIRSILDELTDVFRCHTLRPAFVAARDSVCCQFG